MNKAEELRRRYNPGDPHDMPLNQWEFANHWKLTSVWDAEEVFEQCVMDRAGNIVGDVIKGLGYNRPEGIANFGLYHRVRRTGNVHEARAKRQAAHDAKRAKDAANKSREEVTTIEFDAHWNLAFKETETRMVYTNKTNRVIKTRSNGSPVVHEYKGKNYVIWAPSLNGRIVNQKVWNAALPDLLDKHI